MVLNSLITAPTQGYKAPPGKPVEVRGVAWDGGYGITRVEVSIDDGKLWREATLGKDLGRFSFRPWSFRFTPRSPGSIQVMARASNTVGQTQADKLIFNPAGYHNNIIRPVTVTVG
jgi:sulfite dehydrogenase